MMDDSCSAFLLKLDAVLWKKALQDYLWCRIRCSFFKILLWFLILKSTLQVLHPWHFSPSGNQSQIRSWSYYMYVCKIINLTLVCFRIINFICHGLWVAIAGMCGTIITIGILASSAYLNILVSSLYARSHSSKLINQC